MAQDRKTNWSLPLLVLLVGTFVIFLGWSAFRAVGLGSRVTDVDYYSKGLRYNATRVEKRAAEVLGWNLETRLVGRVLELRLVDGRGNRIERATGSLFLAIPGAAENLRLPLQEFEPGRYRFDLGDRIRGVVQARLEVERDGARLSRQLLLNL